MRILIAGGGIGGLTAALCCLDQGLDVQVFEQASEYEGVGAGLQIPPNAMKVLEALDIQDRITEAAFEPEAIEARMGVSGRMIFTVPLADYARTNWGSPYLHIHRADYITALKSALQDRAPGALYMDAAASSYEQNSDEVVLKLEDGRTFRGDVLIGADGIHSTLRGQMLGPDKPVFTGNVAWRTVVPMKALGDQVPNPTASAWMGRGRHAVTYRICRGDFVNFVGVVERDDWTHEGWTQPGSRDELRQDFAGWHPVIDNIINNASADTLYRWALFDRPPLEQWTQGRTALIGDAAHPMLPFLAQGAAMAVEDAWALASELTQGNRPVNAALDGYQSHRHMRAGRVQVASRENMQTFHQDTRLGQIMTYGPMWLAGRLMPRFVHSRMGWLYGYDVTSD